MSTSAANVAAPSMPQALTPEVLAQFDALRAQYPVEMKSSLVLPLLHCLQTAKGPGGYLGEADAASIAAYIGIPTMQVMEALTWYTMFHKQPTGRHVVKVCRNIACALRGSEQLLGHVQTTLGLKPGQTSADGKYTLLAVECLASCGTAPAMQVNDTYYENLDAAKADAILRSLP
jgi:NADH-quinone oxidoreductase subunit E